MQDVAEKAMKDLKEKILTPQEAVEKAFPSPFIKVKDISVENLEVEPLITGFKSLDKHLVLKSRRPELVVLGAGTSHGKSALMLQIAANVSYLGPVFVYSFEMDERDIKARLLAPRIKVSLEKIMRGFAPSEKLKTADSEFEKMQLFICTNGRNDINYVESSSYELARRVGLPILVVIDYLQLMAGPTKPNRTHEIASILANLKSLAKEMKCPILIGSQLNRECERRGKEIQMQRGKGDYIPIKSDLMDSSSIAHDADVLLFLSRQEVYDGTRRGEADFIIAKNRNGRLSNSILQFTGELCNFLDSTDEAPI